MKMTPRQKFSLLVLTLLSVWGSGCATTDYTVIRHYAPLTPFKESASRFRVFIETDFTPTLPESPEAVGVKKNGYGWEMAHIFVSPSPQQWISQNLLAEFRKAGFTVVTEKGDDVVSITVHVKQMFVEPSVGFSSADVVSIVISKVEVLIPHSGDGFSRKFIGIQSSTELFWFDSIFEKNLVDAAQVTFGQVVEGVYQLLSTQLS